MTLEEYALGQEDSEDTFCRWMEFRSQDLGSMRGGSARKLIIYKHKDKPGWYYPKMFEDERTAWEHLRSDFTQAFALAEQGDWAEIDGLETLAQGPALRLKTLHLYFPDEVLPVYSNDHLRHFLRILKQPDSEASGYAVVQTNQNLLAALRAVPEISGWKPKEFERFLYWWADPRDAHRVVKIAPGEKAKYWDECRTGGYICVGWDDVGDLSQFESKDTFRERFGEAYPYNGHRPSVVRESNELWTLTELEPGDLIVANQGTSKILAIGEVVEPGYQWREDRANFRHTVAVNWDTSYEKSIPAQKAWATVTVKKVPDALFEQLTSSTTDSVPKPKLAVPVDPLYLRIASTIERKGQLVLYGPPGTAPCGDLPNAHTRTLSRNAVRNPDPPLPRTWGRPAPIVPESGAGVGLRDPQPPFPDRRIHNLYRRSACYKTCLRKRLAVPNSTSSSSSSARPQGESAGTAVA